VLKKLYHQFASPKTYIVLVNKIYPYVFYISLCIYTLALIWGLAYAPADYLQGNSFRIMYLHVPASFLSQSLYLVMALAAAVFLIWKVKLAAYMIKAIAPIGALVTLLL
jgi:heme exporter protein C